MQGAPGALTIINGKECLYFGGTSYYGLHNHPGVIHAASEAIKKYGMNSATSRDGFGTTPLLVEIEKKGAEFFETEDAAYLASGFLSNMAGVQALLNIESFDTIFIDQFSHYSNRDAAYSVRKPVFTFKHMDIEDLENKLKQHLSPGQRPLLISDGIFPVFGRLAPVPDYLRILKPYNGIVWLDDAHGLGVMGEQGRGTAEFYSCSSDRLFFGGTMSKAFGGFGGIIPGNTDFIYEIRSGFVMNGASSAPSGAAAASLKGLTLVMEHPEMKIKLRENAHKLKNGLRKLGFETNNSHMPVAAWKLNSSAKMKRVQHELFNRGIAIQYIQYVGAGTKGVLRAVVFSTHTSEQIERLLFELGRLV
jgi:glycine C-acetyltransferase/8-amino-7-oxononanoate synthase